VVQAIADAYIELEPARDLCWTVPWMLETLGAPFSPRFAVIFDQEGQPLWLSDEAIARLGLSCATLGSERLLLRGSPRLLRLWRVVQVRQQSWQQRPQRLSGPDFLASGERLAVGNLGGAEGLVLVVLTRASPPGSSELAPPSGKTARLLSAKGLSRRELEVASMAMRGYSVPNMAALLGVRESTVRTFIKRVYAKLEVRNRAELCFAVLEPLSEAAD
jgi:DNA-binding CsgD family transcriptional regulator